MDPADFPAPTEGFVRSYFLVVTDQDRSRLFYERLFVHAERLRDLGDRLGVAFPA